MKQLEDITEFRSSPELVEKLYTHGILKTYKEGSVILNENSPIRSIPIVIKGVRKVIRTEDEGREILLYDIKAGESCIMSFLGGLHNETSKVKVEIEDDAEILFLPISKVSLFMKEHPEWLNYIFRTYHKRFEELLETINAIAFKKMDERLLDLIHKRPGSSGAIPYRSHTNSWPRNSERPERWSRDCSNRSKSRERFDSGATKSPLCDKSSCTGLGL